jgi:uncharacterized protein YbaA (DUF1428 family)
MLATTPSTASSHSYLFNTDMQGNVKREHSVVAMSEIIEDDEPEGEIHAAARFAMQENDDFQIPVRYISFLLTQDSTSYYAFFRCSAGSTTSG